MTRKHTTKVRLETWSRAVVTLLVVLTILGHGVLPLVAQAFAEHAEADETRDSCCPSAAETPAETNQASGETFERDNPSEDGCCPDGCRDCSLSCCHGLLAVLSPAETLAGPAMAGPSTPAPPSQPSPGDPLGVFRPPRG